MGTSFQYGKNLAGEGSILLILGLAPYVGWVLGIIGIVLLLRGARELANYYQDNEIYQNSWTGLKYYVVALIAIAAASVLLIIGLASIGVIADMGGFGAVGFGVGIGGFIAGLVIAFVFYLRAASHLRKVFHTLAQKSGEHSFATAGSLLWIGSLLTIAGGIGLILIFIAWIYATIGFFSMRPPYQQQPCSYPPPPAPPATQQAEQYCPYCGSPVSPDVVYCPHCGKQLS
ncbi:MAG: DUF996 domain-containing protein [Candidatus Bathyarchaeia archaeon]|jgi:uncharacterized membrane protein